ncbi:CoF synthetase [Bacteroidota bacterium]
MKILEELRRKLFWFIDALKGNKVKNHLKDITFILENYNTKEASGRREDILKKYLDHAVGTTAFYKSYRDYDDITDFPVISKMDIRESYQDLLSEPFKNKKTIEIATSGTTGIPFKIRQDQNKKYRNVADTFYFGGKGGYKIGDRLYYVRKWVKETKRSKIGLFVTNIKQINVTDFSKRFLGNLVSRMSSDSSTKALLGYSSALGDICRYMEETNAPPVKKRFLSIISMAEALSEATRSNLEKYFGAPVVSRYSNSENGIIAQQLLNEGDDYHINWASYYVELLNLENDSPVKAGQLGRIVITDMFNYCMPMIRYDTGDLGILDTKNTNFNNAPVLKAIEGRIMDVIYSTKGEPLSPFVAFEMEYFTELKQFQLIQEGALNYTAKLNLDGFFENEVKLAERLKKFLGQDAIIDFQYVDEFPQLASGKRRLTINNYKQPA